MQYYGLDGEELQQAIKYHKQYAVSNGYKEATVYSGIEKLLGELKQQGKKQAVVTLKQQESAEVFLEYHGLLRYFDCVIGAQGLDTRKDSLLQKCLDKFDAAPKKALLIGDSQYDQTGAAGVSIDFLGVTYGFGFKSEKEIEKLPYMVVCHTVEEIRKKIGE